MYRDWILKKIFADIKNGFSLTVIIAELKEMMTSLADNYMVSQDTNVRDKWLVLQEFVKVLEEAE